MTRDNDESQPTRPRKRVTSAEVARAAGVSRATVSYVLNDAPGRTISGETRQHVLKVAAQMGHVPFAPARSLRLGRSNIVLVLVRDFALGYVACVFLNRLDTALAEKGYVLLLDRYDPLLRSTASLWQMVSPALVVGMAGLSLSEQSMIELGSERFLPLQGSIPNVQIGSLQVNYLHAKGHNQIGYAQVRAPSSDVIGAERLHGVRSECASLAMPDPDVRIIDPFDLDTIEEALDHWLADRSTTAVAAQSDEIALLICSGLEARGLVAGVDLAVMGVDNIPAGRTKLTTVSIDLDRWTGDAIKAVTALLEDRQPSSISSDIVSAIERSTA